MLEAATVTHPPRIGSLPEVLLKEIPEKSSSALSKQRMADSGAFSEATTRGPKIMPE